MRNLKLTLTLNPNPNKRIIIEKWNVIPNPNPISFAGNITARIMRNLKLTLTLTLYPNPNT